MRIPRDVGGDDLAKLLAKYGYEVTRQTGSHMRLTTVSRGQHHLTIPRHSSLKLGTLNNILGDVAEHLGIAKEILVQELFSKSDLKEALAIRRSSVMQGVQTERDASPAPHQHTPRHPRKA